MATFHEIIAPVMPGEEVKVIIVVPMLQVKCNRYVCSLSGIMPFPFTAVGMTVDGTFYIQKQVKG